MYSDVLQMCTFAEFGYEKFLILKKNKIEKKIRKIARASVLHAP